MVECKDYVNIFIQFINNTEVNYIGVDDMYVIDNSDSINIRERPGVFYTNYKRNITYIKKTVTSLDEIFDYYLLKSISDSVNSYEVDFEDWGDTN